tara:strand:- start:237 stop:470 length:234 start_codon:yes stop_codon:yes gene_type:complete
MVEEVQVGVEVLVPLHILKLILMEIHPLQVLHKVILVEEVQFQEEIWVEVVVEQLLQVQITLVLLEEQVVQELLIQF